MNNKYFFRVISCYDRDNMLRNKTTTPVKLDVL